MGRAIESAETKESKRPLILRIIFCIFAALLIIVLFRIQIIDTDKYGSGSVVSSEEVTVEAARGEILDRNGNALVKNRQGNSIVFDASYFPSASKQTQRDKIIYKLIKMFKAAGQGYNDWLPITVDSNGNAVFDETRTDDIKWLKSSDMLDLNSYATADNCLTALIKRYDLEGYSKQDARDIASVCVYMKKCYFSKSYPYTFAEDVPTSIVAQIMENSSFYKGVENNVVAYREYTDGTIAPHILGRVSGISADTYSEKKKELESEIEKAQENGATDSQIAAIKRNAYKITDDYGQSGIELAMEDYLRGKRGVKVVSTDTDGNVTEKYTVEPQQGDTVILTIDKNLQVVAQNALKNRVDTLNVSSALDCAAAVIVEDVHTGEILACATYPTYDNNTYTENYSSLVKDPDDPLWNRALMSTYEPGSTMKPCVATAALEEGVITGDTTFTCHRVWTHFSDTTFICQGYHGSINVVDAIYHSCNIFFYETGLRLGIEKMNKWATAFGLGQKTGCELPEAAGILAGKEYRESQGGTWNPGDTVQAAIGQSDNQFTLIQLCNYVATIANGGTRYVPHFVKAVETYDYSKTLLQKQPEVAAQLNISANTLKLVKEGMLKVGTIGSCQAAFSGLPVTAAAKTGTAQIKRVVNGTTVEGTNGFLISFAPYEDPEIAVAVVVETADAGKFAAVVAADIYNYYFSAKGVDTSETYNTLLS